MSQCVALKNSNETIMKLLVVKIPLLLQSEIKTLIVFIDSFKEIRITGLISAAKEQVTDIKCCPSETRHWGCLSLRE